MSQMEIPSKYNPAEVEDKWYKYWMDNKYFHSTPDEREPYTIVIPPPNVTGVLHMGHMLNNTIQDILVRRARMTGKNACWVPGTDHASIATEAKVVNKLNAEGIDKYDLSRDEFLKHAWEWTDKHGGIILEQLKKLGASCDWDRTAFTMDEARSESVIKVFVDLFNKGMIYRGVRMVNWDPAAKTALSDEEVIYKEMQGKLYYLNYKIEGEEGFVTIATTRPETILGDTAVCVNPNDERFAHLKGKRVLVPLINRSIPIIEDEYVDMEFGTGCLKITPAHDINDYEIGLRYNLPSIDIFNDNGTLNEKAELYVGEDRFVVRDKIVPELEKAGNLAKVEDYTNKVGFSERTDVIIEPKLSAQWFLKMEELVKPALENVMNDTISFHPPKFKNTYKHWMGNIKDWCISRQLWWGHQIPVYYLPDGTYVCAESAEEALELAKEKSGNAELTAADLKQDEDALDTWFSSWLWPISVFDGVREPENEEVNYYYPSSDLVTAPDIIFFWVARMIIAGYEYRDDFPFKNVYFTGMVRDAQRRKMSKSLGNSPDPLDLIAKYGADGVRVGMLLCSPAGGDLLFDESLPQQGAGFSTKIWNAFRLVKNWEVSSEIEQPEHSKLAIEWFKNKLSQVVETLNAQFDSFRISEALMTVYTTVRDEFSGWLLEMVKPAYQQPIDAKTYTEILELFDQMLRLMHPFMPFITEEIWQLLEERKEGESIMISQLPTEVNYDAELLAAFEDVKEAVSGIRKIRKDKNIAFKDAIDFSVQKGDKGFDAKFNSILIKLGNLTELTAVDEEVKGAASFRVKSTSFYIPLDGFIDVEEELKKLEEELKYAKGFLNSVMKKLSNERFVNNAPEAVVAKEKAKQADAEANIKVLEERIASMK
ncbi:valyl-tRNA synthetase [Draconibacterium orientale]|uniref:Valine--tRNA ligase n=2 Tax=Draconibacterium orientale TaxID=1168034 RepID=A0A1I0E6D1_9BACT|nr:valine--tRNA ligase [Draconibacterium orientale]SET40371.1 valyl-tRNA synthetase [Draconibacterium orientale]